MGPSFRLFQDDRAVRAPLEAEADVRPLRRVLVGRVVGILGNCPSRGRILVMLASLDYKQCGDDREDESADINPKQVFFTGHSDFSIESSNIDVINPVRDVMKTNGFGF